jgi:protein-arginine kinase activator protein McsA
MIKEFSFETRDEFEKFVASKNKDLSIAIVDGIAANFNSKKNHIHVVTIAIAEEDHIYDLTVDKKLFLDTLEQNLETLLEHELYEKCVEVKNLIDKLKNKKL